MTKLKISFFLSITSATELVFVELLTIAFCVADLTFNFNYLSLVVTSSFPPVTDSITNGAIGKKFKPSSSLSLILIFFQIIVSFCVLLGQSTNSTYEKFDLKLDWINNYTSTSFYAVIALYLYFNR